MNIFIIQKTSHYTNKWVDSERGAALNWIYNHMEDEASICELDKMPYERIRNSIKHETIISHYRELLTNIDKVFCVAGWGADNLATEFRKIAKESNIPTIDIGSNGELSHYFVD